MPQAKTDEKKTIQYKIAEIKKLAHYENDFREFGLNENELEPMQVQFTMKTIRDESPNSISIYMKVDFLDKEQRFNLFGLTCIYRFEIKGLEIKFTKEGTFQLPKEATRQFLSLIISGVRGMLVAVNTTPEYHKILLPLIDPDDLASELEKANPFPSQATDQ
ncbi:MAG TPA: hypothetical protein VGA99_00450 [bacterium]